MSVVGNEFLSLLKRITKKNVEHFCRFLCIGGSHRNKPSGLGAHCCAPHHIRLVLTETLGSLESVFLVSELCEKPEKADGALKPIVSVCDRSMPFC